MRDEIDGTVFLTSVPFLSLEGDTEYFLFNLARNLFFSYRS